MSLPDGCNEWDQFAPWNQDDEPEATEEHPCFCGNYQKYGSCFTCEMVLGMNEPEAVSA